MDIPNFELIIFHAVYVGILWLTLSSLSQKQLSSILHYSNTPILLDELLPEEPNSSTGTQRTIIFEYKPPNSGRPRSFFRPALLPGRARRSVWEKIN
jgi:hypothetical protein